MLPLPLQCPWILFLINFNAVVRNMYHFQYNYKRSKRFVDFFIFMVVCEKPFLWQPKMLSISLYNDLRYLHRAVTCIVTDFVETFLLCLLWYNTKKLNIAFIAVHVAFHGNGNGKWMFTLKTRVKNSQWTDFQPNYWFSRKWHAINYPNILIYHSFWAITRN